jgi:hypothetical protein
MMVPKRYTFPAGQNRRNRAFRISGFQIRPMLPFQAAIPKLWLAGDNPGEARGQLRERTSHLRYKTDQRHALQRSGTLMVPRLWSHAR